MSRSIIITVLVSATAFAAGAQDKDLSVACPNLSAAERQEIERAERDPKIFGELNWYSRAYCVSLAESKRRLDIQTRDAIGAETEPGGPTRPPADSIGSISQAVEAKETATFAGLWIEHQPAFRVVVAFTRDAAATLRKYTRDPLFVALDRPGPSQADLRRTQDRLMADLQRLGARPSMASTDIRGPRVEFQVLGDLAPFQAAVARGEVEMPPYVVIRGPEPLKIAAPALPADWRNRVKAFPRAKFRSGGIELAILRTGTVILEGGCLRLKGERHNPVIVWPNEAALDLVTKPGEIRILNRMSGDAIEPGQRTNLGGNAGELTDEAAVIDGDPACAGPYYQMGNFGPMDRFDRIDLENRANELQQQKKLSRAVALRMAQDERDREQRFRELGERLLREAPASFAGINPYQGRATIKFALDPTGEVRRHVPSDLRPFVKAERAPRPLAALKADKDRFLDQVERMGIRAGAYEDVEQGRVVISADDLAALGKAAASGRLTFPANAQVQSSGALPEGPYSEAGLQRLNRALEAVPDWTEMRALVEQTKVPGYLVTYREGEPDRGPTRGQSLEITRFLVSMGYTASDLRALHAEGLFPARAYVEQNGRSSIVNRALLAQEIVVAEVIDVKPELLGDGYRSTVRIRVREALKGDLRPSEEATVRFVSGPGADGKFHQSNEEPMLIAGLPGSVEPSSRWLMLLSEGMYARQAALVGKARSAPAAGSRIFATIYGTWPVVGQTIGGAYAEPSPGDLGAVRAGLAAVDDKFERAKKRRGAPLQRRLVP